jgi:glycosyltransferase involved in cell wall biosynthesis
MISVIIPTFNRSNVLKETLHSYFSPLVLEIIIVDDGSKDDTFSVIKSFKDSRIKYIKHEKRMGLCAARNTGIKNISNESNYIFFGEDDVFLIEKCYDIMLKEMKKGNFDLISTNVKYLSEDDDYKKFLNDDIKTIQPITFNDILSLRSIHLAKREIYEKFKFDEGYILNSYREETDFYLRVSEIYKVGFIKNYLAFNLPRLKCEKGGQWTYNPFAYEFGSIYNNFRFFIKNRKIIDLTFWEFIKFQFKFIINRLRALKSKVFK